MRNRTVGPEISSYCAYALQLIYNAATERLLRNPVQGDAGRLPGGRVAEEVNELGEDRMLKRRLGLLLLSAMIMPVSIRAGAAARQQKNMGATDLVALLEKAGYTYNKVGDGIWEIQFKGKNVPEFPVRIALSDDIVLVMAKVADRKNLVHAEQLFQKLLELNDKMDTIKFALSSDMLYIRLEVHSRLLDQKELQYALDQTSAAVDESYPQIKQFLSGSK